MKAGTSFLLPPRSTGKQRIDWLLLYIAAILDPKCASDLPSPVSGKLTTRPQDKPRLADPRPKMRILDALVVSALLVGVTSGTLSARQRVKRIETVSCTSR